MLSKTIANALRFQSLWRLSGISVCYEGHVQNFHLETRRSMDISLQCSKYNHTLSGKVSHHLLKILAFFSERCDSFFVVQSVLVVSFQFIHNVLMIEMHAPFYIVYIKVLKFHILFKILLKLSKLNNRIYVSQPQSSWILFLSTFYRITLIVSYDCKCRFILKS